MALSGGDRQTLRRGDHVVEDCTIRATTFSAPLTQGPGRGLAMPDEETVGESEQTVAWLMFDCAEGTRFGVFDWNQEIYRSCTHLSTPLPTLSAAPDPEAGGPSVLCPCPPIDPPSTSPLRGF